MLALAASSRAQSDKKGLMHDHEVMILLLFLQKQNLASLIYLFGLGTLLFTCKHKGGGRAGPGKKAQSSRLP
jgi:hypothetical protein